jgi:Peptidase family S41
MKKLTQLLRALSIILLGGLYLSPAIYARNQVNTLTYISKELTAQQTQEDVRLLKRALETVHPGLTRYTSAEDIARAFSALEASTKNGSDEIRLYSAISLMLAQIRCDHTKAELPAALEKFRNEQPTHLPFRFSLIEGKMIVEKSDPLQTVIARGTEVLSINGEPVADLIKALLPYVSIDGFTERSRLAKLASDSDLMGSDFDHFYPLISSTRGFAKSFTLTLKAPRQTAITPLSLKPLTYPQWSALAGRSDGQREQFYNSITWRMSNENAVLRIGSFVNYRNPVEPMAFYAAFFKQLNAQKTKHLVIDLRGNGGGSGDTNIALLRYLLDTPFVWNKPRQLKAVRYGDLPKYIETWGDPKEIFEPPMSRFKALAEGGFEEIVDGKDDATSPQAPAADVFKGKVTVLSDARNGSGTTMFIAKFKDENRGQVIGEATGGSAEGPTAGQLFFLKLPNSGITVRVPNMFNRMNIKSFTRGMGVQPDVDVKQTLEDFLNTKDRALDAALGR